MACRPIVHFHEVGAIDSVVDVVGVCAALHHLDPDQISCDPRWGMVRQRPMAVPVPSLPFSNCAPSPIPLRRGSDFPGVN